MRKHAIWTHCLRVALPLRIAAPCVVVSSSRLAVCNCIALKVWEFGLKSVWDFALAFEWDVCGKRAPLKFVDEITSAVRRSADEAKICILPRTPITISESDDTKKLLVIDFTDSMASIEERDTNYKNISGGTIPRNQSLEQRGLEKEHCVQDSDSAPCFYYSFSMCQPQHEHCELICDIRISGAESLFATTAKTVARYDNRAHIFETCSGHCMLNSHNFGAKLLINASYDNRPDSTDSYRLSQLYRLFDKTKRAIPFVYRPFAAVVSVFPAWLSTAVCIVVP